MKKIFVSISIVLLLCLCSCSSTSNDNNFEICTEDFEAINNVLLNIDPDNDRLLFSVVSEDGKDTEIYNFPIELNENELHSLNRLSDTFKTDFSFIEITEERISYGGEGGDMLVYSIEGKTPKYFHYVGDRIDFSVKSLGHKWYFCHARIR